MRDYFVISEAIWKYIHTSYNGEEIKRFAINKNYHGLLDRTPSLPLVKVTLIVRDEAINYPKWMILPRKSSFFDLKKFLREIHSWLKEYLDDELRIWRLNPELKDLDFIDQYNQ